MQHILILFRVQSRLNEQRRNTCGRVDFFDYTHHASIPPSAWPREREINVFQVEPRMEDC